MAANHAFWNLNLLLPLAREYRVTTYDLRGHGYSEMPPRGYTSADFAEDLVGLPNYHIYLKLMIDGAPSKPFSAITVQSCEVIEPEQFPEMLRKIGETVNESGS